MCLTLGSRGSHTYRGLSPLSREQDRVFSPSSERLLRPFLSNMRTVTGESDDSLLKLAGSSVSHLHPLLN